MSASPAQTILHFAPQPKTVVWGGSRIARLKGLADAPDAIGESWEVSPLEGSVSVVDRGPFRGMALTDLAERYGEAFLGSGAVSRHGRRFPILLKFIDAAKDLSVQVHPRHDGPEPAPGEAPKTEMWVILSADPGAALWLGFDGSREDFDRHVGADTVMDAMHRHDSRPWDCYYIPGGTVHAIGAGNLLVEVQQASDTTFRIFDYNRPGNDGRPRPLHIDRARRAIDFDGAERPRGFSAATAEGGNPLVACPFFDTRLLCAAAGRPQPVGNTADSFTLVTCLQGRARLSAGDQNAVLPEGDTVLLPASLPPAVAEGDARLLVVTA